MKAILLLTIGCFLCIHIHAEEQFIFSTINTLDGLADNKIRDIAQMPDGRLLICTESMVNIYDATSFKVVHLNEDNAYHFPGFVGYVQMLVGAEGYIWIKSHEELELISIDTESCVSNIDSVLFSLGIKEPVTNVFMDSRQNLWFTTQSNKLLFRDTKKKETSIFIENLPELSDKADRLSGVVIHNNLVYLFFIKGLTLCYDINTGKEKFSKNLLPDDVRNSRFWEMITTVEGDFIYQVRSGAVSMVLRYDTRTGFNETVIKTDRWLNKISFDKAGNAWIGHPQGLWYIDKFSKKTLFYPSRQLLENVFLDTEISALYHDNNDGFWIGTYDRGLLYYHPDRFKFKKIEKSDFGINNHKALLVGCFLELNDKILIGTAQGLFSLNQQTDELSPVMIGDNHPSYCNFLCKDISDRIWFGAPEGLYQLNPFRQELKKNVSAFYEDNNGTIYLGVYNEGFGIYDPERKTFNTIKDSNGNNVLYVLQILKFRENELLLACSSSLYIYNTSNGTITVPSLSKNMNPIAFRHNNQSYTNLLIDSRGLIWFGTKDGLNVWNETENKLYTFYAENGLINSGVNAIIEDDNHKIWVSTFNGVSCIDVAEVNGMMKFSFTNFNHYDGIINYEFVNRSAYKTKQGLILLGGLDGFNIINPEVLYQNRQPLSKPLFTKFSLLGTEIKSGEKYNGNIILTQSITTTNAISLKYNQNFFTLEFSALNFVNPTQTFYRCQLEGVDDKWNETASIDGTGRVTYTNLSPGKYVFRTQAANNFKQWSNEFAELNIIVHPPFWKTNWAYFAYTILFMLLFYGSINYYLQLKKRKLERIQKERMDEMKFRFFTNVSHELRTPLSLILTPLDVIIKKQEEGKLKEQLKDMYKNAMGLLEQVNQLLDFRRLEMKGETLHLSYFNIGEFIESTTLSFNEIAQNKNINFQVECLRKDICAYVDKDKLNKIIYNLLSNAFKFTPKDGFIHVIFDYDPSFNEENGALCVQVTDSGCGIQEKDMPHIFTRFYRAEENGKNVRGSGIGLHIVQEYVHLHNGVVQVESKPGKGSTFKVYIPANLKPNEVVSETNQVSKNSENKCKLLVVEDNEEFLAFLYEHLSEFYDVTTAINGKTGLEKIDKALPDLILSDVMMPEMDGIQFCKKIKADIRTSHVPVILLTARTTDNAEFEGYASGADAYIPKPFSMEVLLLRIRKLLEKQEERKALFKNAIVIHPENITTTNIDEKLIGKAIEYVKKNIQDSSYSVKQLSQDMNMDRTGLYRKILALTGQTPIVFIRSIRLKRAAQLLEQGLSVSEVADQVGFLNNSYLSKWFQEEYGMKPLQYAKKSKVHG